MVSLETVVWTSDDVRSLALLGIRIEPCSFRLDMDADFAPGNLTQDQKDYLAAIKDHQVKIGFLVKYNRDLERRRMRLTHMECFDALHIIRRTSAEMDPEHRKELEMMMLAQGTYAIDYPDGLVSSKYLLTLARDAAPDKYPLIAKMVNR